MDDERLMILRMLEEGKISAAEAAELLRALDEGGSGGREASGASPEPRRPGEGVAEAARDAAREWMRRGEELAQRLARRGEEIAGRLGDDASRLAELIQRRVEESLRRLPELLDSVEHLGRALELPQRVERVLTGRFAEGDPGDLVLIDLTGVNGPLQVEGWDEEDYRLTISAHLPRGAREEGGDEQALGRAVAIEQEARRLAVRPAGELRSLSVSLRLPSRHRYVLKLHTANGAILVAGVDGRELRAATDNARIVAERVGFEQAVLETSNSRISVSGAVRDLEARTANAPIAAGIELESLEGEARWTLRTSNAPITCRVPAGPGYGYDIDAATTVGRVYVDTGEHAHDVAVAGEGRQAVAVRSPGFAERQRRLVLHARTTNGSVRIEPRVGA